MSKYTIELRKLADLIGREKLEEVFKSYNEKDYLTDEQIKIINDKGYFKKDKLAKMIVDHYYMSEIGFETPGLFIHNAKVLMEEIMDEYLPLIYSSSIDYDPLVNVDYTETFTKKGNSDKINIGNATTKSNNTSNGLTINSNTPQKRVTKEDIINGIYASNTGYGDSNTTLEDNTNTTNNEIANDSENYTKKIKGNSGVSATAQKMIEQYRDNIRAIYREIIEKLNILFMGIY